MQTLLGQWCRVFAVGIGVLLFAAGLDRLNAQSAGGTLSGTIVDQASKPIQNASVEIKNETTGASSSVTTDSEGHFSATGLPPGGYTIIVSAQGFADHAPRREGHRRWDPGHFDPPVGSNSRTQRSRSAKAFRWPPPRLPRATRWRRLPREPKSPPTSSGISCRPWPISPRW